MERVCFVVDPFQSPILVVTLLHNHFVCTTAHSALNSPPLPPAIATYSFDWSARTLKHHGKSGRGRDGEVRGLMALNFAFFLILPAGEKVKARNWCVRLERSRPQVPEKTEEGMSHHGATIHSAEHWCSRSRKRRNSSASDASVQSPQFW